MAVLKSLDLKGNKQSFAGWISNLSPCDTPFVSMINKEATDQTQYSWQIDALDAPSKIEGYEEGSDAVAQLLDPTIVNHNFTSVLRKIVNISDTVTALSTHGRNSEVAYQMGKAGKEMKRDMEFMLLNNPIGNIGSAGRASAFSGFRALCGQGTDAVTGSKVVNTISVADANSPWFKASDIFNVTYNLYLSGSKANKIMFHPRHALTFSTFMSANIESPMTYRMFDGLATEFNTKVSTLRDPLAQKYDLISNRHMPEDAIYFFNESDWTQMILRQPAVSPLGKKGSSERFLLESEIGLRHRNPYASGVLVMEKSNLLFEWIEKPTPMTWGIGADMDASISIKVRATGANVADGTTVDWSSSNPLVVEVADETGQTADGKAVVLLKPQRPGTSIITASHAEGAASYLVTVKDPSIRLRMASSLVEKGKGTLAIVQVLNADGTPVADGIEVNFTAQPGHLVTMPARTDVTKGGSGTAQVEINAVQELGVVQVGAHIGSVHSNNAKLEIVEKVQALGMTVDRDMLAMGVNDSVLLNVFVWDASGTPIPSQSVSLLTTDQTVIRIPHTPVDTGVGGTYQIRLTAAGIGDTVIVAQYQGQLFEIPVAVRAPSVELDGPASYEAGVEFSVAATVTRADGTFLPAGTEVEFTSDPAFTSGTIIGRTTDVGVASINYTSLTNSDLEITAKAGQTRSNTITVSGPDL